MLTRRLGAIISVILLVAGTAAATGEPSQHPECSVASLFADAETTIDACTTIIRRSDLDLKTHVESLKIRGRAARSLGRLDESERDYVAGIAIAPDDPEFRVRLGEVVLLKGDGTRALALADEAVTLDPGYARAFALRGSAMRYQRQFDSALRAFDKAIQLDPTEALHQFDRFRLLRDLRMKREALMAADRILRMPQAAITEPGTVIFTNIATNIQTGVRIDRARLLDGMGRHTEAEAGFDEAVKEDPSGLTFAWRAQFRNSLQNEVPELVQEDLDKALALEPNYWLAHKVIAGVHARAKRYEAAVEEYGIAAKLNPQNGILLWWRAMSLRELGRVEEAMADALAAIDSDVNLLNEKLLVLQQSGYLQEVHPNASTPDALRDAVIEAVRDAVRACMLDERCG